jgi:hypothetical protein
MRIPQTVMATAAVVTTLVGMSVTGCSSHPKSSTPTSGSGAPTHAPIVDYTQLLIKASDINAPAPESFAAGPATKNPNGQQGATITFTDQDHSHTIIDTIQILPDAEATATALDSAKALHRETLRTKALNAEVGVGGVTISGLPQDHSKGVTVLLFTEGNAMVTLEFEGPSFALAPPEFVTEVGQKQDDALKKGLGG